MKFSFVALLSLYSTIPESSTAFTVTTTNTATYSQQQQQLSEKIPSALSNTISSPSIISRKNLSPLYATDKDDDTAVDETVSEADELFDSIDVNNDGGITNDELREYLEKAGYTKESIRYLFTAFDSNADGIISREEMRYAFSNYEISALYKAFGLAAATETTTKATESSTSEEKQLLLDQIQFNEAIKDIRSKSKIDDKTVPWIFSELADSVFDMIDKDKNGDISKEELREYFEKNKGDFTAVESIFTALDLNSDGSISREEMRNGFQEYDHRALSKAFGFTVARRSEV
mmetsp:Transcript_130/g.157  ORF Transcript_130/g.157 Transcript_130/m.157 type:complete len:290 (+) Transcript_130:147-1016(+)